MYRGAFFSGYGVCAIACANGRALHTTGICGAWVSIPLPARSQIFRETFGR